MSLEVADDAVERHVRVAFLQLDAGALDDGLADIEGDVSRQGLGFVARVQQHPGLGGRAGAQLHDLPGRNTLHQLVGNVREDAEFRPRGVVLRQLGDLLEEQGALFIIEKLGE